VIRGVVAAAIVLALGHAAHAQTTAPTPTAGTPDATGFAYRYSAGVDGNIGIGIIDRYLFNLRGDALIATRTAGVYIEPKLTYSRINKKDTDRESYLRVVGFLFPRETIYGFAVGLAERSLRRKYEVRLTGGAGVGFNVVRTPNVELLFAEGLVYEFTHFYNAVFAGHPAYTDESRQVVRVVTRASGRIKLAAKTQLFYDIYLKPSITSISDYRVLAKASFELAVAHGITARALLDYTQETIRLVGTARDELTLVFGVAIRKE
jgi:hypothetical protein